MGLIGLYSVSILSVGDPGGVHACSAVLIRVEECGVYLTLIQAKVA